MSELLLREFIPDGNFRDDDSGHLDLFINHVLQPVLDLALEDLDRFKKQNDPDEADENVVDAMLRDLGNPFEVAFDQPLNRRRLLVRVLIQVYLSKGTVPGLVDVIRTLTGIEVVDVVWPATIDAWDLGVDVLSDGSVPDDEDFTDYAILGPSPGFMRYSFQIEVPRALTADEKETITEIVGLVKPAHTHFVGFLEPEVGADVEHWELGVSRLWDGTSPLIGDEVDLHGP